MMESVEVPDEFRCLGGMLFDGIFDLIESEDEMYEAMIDPLSAEGRQTVITFLEKILAEDFSDLDLEEIWSKSTSSYYVSNGKIRYFLTEILNRLRTYKESKSGKTWASVWSEEE